MRQLFFYVLVLRDSQKRAVNRPTWLPIHFGCRRNEDGHVDEAINLILDYRIVGARTWRARFSICTISLIRLLREAYKCQRVFSHELQLF